MSSPPEPSRPPDEPARRRPDPRPGSTEEALRRLEERLDRASEAAERLMAQAAAAAAEAIGGGGDGGGGSNRGGGGGGGGEGAGNPGGTDAGNSGGADGPPKPPPAGWQPPDEPTHAIPDLDPLLSLAQAVRDLIPPELQRRLVAALRELLLALRALIDWYLERLERKREQSAEIQDIPIL